MLGAFIVTRQWRNNCIIHFQLEGCLNAHNTAANPNTLPSLTSAGSLKPITSSLEIHHRAICLDCLFWLSILLIIIIKLIFFFYQLNIYLAEVIISSLDLCMSISTYMKQTAHSHPPSRVSHFCLYHEWMASSILAGVLGSNQWCLVPAEITGVTGAWAHEFSSGDSVNAFVRFHQHQIYCRLYQGLTEWLSLLYGFFSADFIRMACQWQQPPADLQEVVISPGALVPLGSGGGSAAWCLVLFYKEKIIFICHAWKGSLVLPLVGMATGWHTDSPLPMTVSAKKDILS